MNDPFDVLESVKFATPNADDPFKALEAVKFKPTAQENQGDRYQQALEWANRTAGGDAAVDRVLRGVGLPGNAVGPFGIRPRDISMPFQGAANAIARFATGRESDATLLQQAEEALARNDNSVTDDQLQRIAVARYEEARNKSMGFKGEVAQTAAGLPGMIAEQLVGASAVTAAAKGAGYGRLVEGATTAVGKAAQSAGIQAAATPLTPSTYLAQAEANQAKNGGNLLSVQNVSIPLFRAAATNAVMGHIAGATGKYVLPVRVAAGAAIMPAEQAAADAIAGFGEDLFVKAGMPKSMQSDTRYGTLQMLAEGRRGEALKKVAIEAIMGGMFSAFAGKPVRQVDELSKAIDSLAKEGMAPEAAGKAIVDAMAKPDEAATPEVKTFVESVAEAKPEAEQPQTRPEDVQTFASRFGSDEPVVPQETVQSFAESFGREEPAAPSPPAEAPPPPAPPPEPPPRRVLESERDIFAEYVPKQVVPLDIGPGRGMGAYSPPMPEPVAAPPDRPAAPPPAPPAPPEPPRLPSKRQRKAEEAAARARQERADAERGREEAKARAAKAAELGDARYNPDLDDVFGSLAPPKPGAGSAADEAIRNARAAQAEVAAAQPQAAAAQEPKPAPIMSILAGPPSESSAVLSPPTPAGKTPSGQSLARHAIADANGKEIGEVKVYQSGETLHINWMGLTGAGATDKAAKGAMGERSVMAVYRQLAELYPTAILASYTPAEGRINAGRQKYVKLENIRRRIARSNPVLREEANAIQNAIQAGVSPEAIARRIVADESPAGEVRQSEAPPADVGPEGTGQVGRGAEAAAENRAAGSGGLIGNETTIAVAGAKPIPGRYEIREMASIVASHKVAPDGGLVSRQGEYPENLQPRDYTNDISERGKVKRLAMEMEPRYYLSDDPGATGGPSTITPDGIVLNGNGRQMSLEEAARIGTYGRYRDQIVKKASQFGFDPAAVEAMKQPVLVRVVNMDAKSDVAKDFAGRGNVAPTQSQTPERKAASMGRMIDDAVLGSLKITGDETFAEAVNSPKGAAFRKRLRERLPPESVNELFNENDTLTDAGKVFVGDMLVTKVFPVDVLERIKGINKNVANALEASAVQFVALDRGADVNPVPAVREAVEFLSRNPQITDLTEFAKAFDQIDIFGSRAELAPAPKMMLEFIVRTAMEGKTAVFRKGIVKMTEDLSGLSKQNLFGEIGPPLSESEKIAEVLGVKARTGADFRTAKAKAEAPRGDDLAEGSVQFGAPLSEAEKRIGMVGGGSGLPEPQRIPDRPPRLGSYNSERRPPRRFRTPPPEAPAPAPPRPAAPPEAPPPRPPEPAPKRPPLMDDEYKRLTALANAAVDAERAKNGLPPLFAPARLLNADVWDAAMAQIGRDPNVSARLVEELATQPRAITVGESALLLHRKIALANEYDRTLRNLVNAMIRKDAGRPRLEIRQKELLEQIDRLDRVTRAVGSETGRALQFRKQLAAEDYRLSRMMLEATRAKGAPLDDAQVRQIADLQDRIEKLQARVQDFEAAEAAKAREAEAPVVETPDVEPPAAPAAPAERGLVRRIGDWLASFFTMKAPNENLNKQLWDFADQLEERAKAELAKRGKDVFSGFDPTLIAPLAKYTAAKIIKAGLTFADFSSQMMAKFGESVKPHLETIWEQAQRHAKMGDYDAADARIELKKAIGEYQGLRDRLSRSGKPTIAKAVEGVKETNNVVRAVITAWDYSAPFRQGAMLTLSRPSVAMKAMGEMLKSGYSERYYQRAQDAIMQRDNAQNGLYEASGLYLAEYGANPSRAEEAYIGRLVSKIPGLAGSQRAFNAYLNRMRADVFDSMTATLAKDGAPSVVEARAIASYINKATGRGTLGRADASAAALAQWFFSPRYLASRFQILAGQPFYGGTGRTRSLIAKEYGRALAGLGALYAAASFFDDDMKVTFDPRSADFGKMQFGRSRVDPLAGFSQVTVLGGRLLSGETKSVKDGKVRVIRGEGMNYGGETSGDVLLRFARNKLAPLPGEAADVLFPKYQPLREGPIKKLTESDSLGVKVADKIVPISVGDVVAEMREHGFSKGSALSMLAILGMGSQVYEDRKPGK